MVDSVEAAVEQAVEELGFEVVELERAGSKNRPLLRLRIDRLSDVEGVGVTLEDCTRASRAIEARLDERDDISERYVLEVSSPGVERPLVRPRDFERFAGSEIAVVGKGPVYGSSKRVEGELIGLDSGDQIILRTAKDEEVAIPRGSTKRVHLIYHWGEEGLK